jgi:hypothetical protein
MVRTAFALLGVVAVIIVLPIKGVGLGDEAWRAKPRKKEK